MHDFCEVTQYLTITPTQLLSQHYMNLAKRVTRRSTKISLFVILGILPSTSAVLAQDHQTNVSQIPAPMPSEDLMPLPTNMPSPLPSITSTPSPSSSVFAPLTPYYMPASPPASGVWPSTGVSVPGLPSSMPYIRPQEKKNKRSYVSSQEYFGGTEQKFDENAYWSQFPIPKISKKFTPKQRSKIWQALLIAQERMQSEQVLDCIDKRVTTKEYDDETSREAVRRFITNAQLSLVEDPAILPGKNRRQYLYIEDKPFSFHKRSSYNGWAKIGYSRFIEKRDLTINLNSVAISKHDADGWAGIIVHEIMHLHSYDHKDYDIKINHYEQFKGNLTYETGWCVSSKGDEQEYASRSNSSILLTAPNNLPLDPDFRPLEGNSDFPQDSLRNLED